KQLQDVSIRGWLAPVRPAGPLVEGAGFEPAYAVKRADLQSAGINHSPTLPGGPHACPGGGSRDGLTPAQMRPKRDPASQRSASYSDEGSTTQPVWKRIEIKGFSGWRCPEGVAARARGRAVSPRKGGPAG